MRPCFQGPISARTLSHHSIITLQKGVLVRHPFPFSPSAIKMTSAMTFDPQYADPSAKVVLEANNVVFRVHEWNLQTFW